MAATQAPLLNGTERITITPNGMVAIPTRLLDPATLHHLTTAIPNVEHNTDSGMLTIDGAASPFAYPTLGQRLLDLPHVIDVTPPALLDRMHTAVSRYARAINDSQTVTIAPERRTELLTRLPDPITQAIRPYQIAGIDFVTRKCRGRGFLGDDPGAGKSIMAISALYVPQPTSFPAIVVCKATLKANWVREFTMWTGDTVESVVLEGQTNLGDSLPHADVYIVNYELLHHRLDDLLRVRPRALIVDESQMLKTVAYSDEWVGNYMLWKAEHDQAIAEWRQEVRDLKAAAAAASETAKPPKDLQLPKRPKTMGKPKPPATGGAWRTWASKKIAHHPTVQTVLLLSATPAPNGRNLEWLPQIDLLDRLDDLGGEDAFIQRYARWCKDCVDEFTGQVARECTHRTYAQRFGRRNDEGSINSAELATRLRSLMMVRRSQRQMYPDLPPIQQIPVDLPMADRGTHPETGETVNWRTEYKQAEDEFVQWLKDHAAGKARTEGDSVGRAVARAVNTAEGDYAKLVQLSHLRKIAAYAKMDATVDWLGDWVSESPDGDEPRQAVVFAWHKTVQKALIARLGEWLDSPAGQARKQRLEAAYGGSYPGIPSILAATEMKGDEIEANKARFNNNPDEPFIVCSIAAAAEGHSMSKAGLVMAYSLPPTGPGTLRQMAGRSYGRADAPSGTVLALVNCIDPKGTLETIDQRLYRAMMGKQVNMATVLDLGQMREIERGDEPTATDVMGDVFASYLR
ncbi:Superfamily II DNA/RNA helicase (plasmid) [Euzebya pacifica]|uniref:Superfamily II DNA/RNA helicase n=1 Tax=Euzebya pacifica TaxID=1608957 RepID=A0A346Y6I1_9ACTN|nr:SNF2-related protein [Euzebya pacifica]AXV10078.1 Superfamily II DNA/RNA helicase [Euzebya pacifica]